MNDEHVLALVEAVHGTHFDAVHEFAAYAALVDDVGQLRVLSADRRAEFIHGALAVVALWLKMNAEKQFWSDGCFKIGTKIRFLW